MFQGCLFSSFLGGWDSALKAATILDKLGAMSKVVSMNCVLSERFLNESIEDSQDESSR